MPGMVPKQKLAAFLKKHPGCAELTVAYERKRQENLLKVGTTCEVCTRYVRLYKYPLKSTLALSLIYLYKAAPDGSVVDLSQYIRDKGWKRNLRDAIAELRHFGLAEPANPNSVATHGRWKITPLGVAFVLGKKVVPGHVFLLKNQCVGKSNSFVDIRTALGTKFNYYELMKPIP